MEGLHLIFLLFGGESFGRFGVGEKELPVYCCSTVAGGVHLMILMTSFALLVVLKGISNAPAFAIFLV